MKSISRAASCAAVVAALAFAVPAWAQDRGQQTGGDGARGGGSGLAGGGGGNDGRAGMSGGGGSGPVGASAGGGFSGGSTGGSSGGGFSGGSFTGSSGGGNSVLGGASPMGGTVRARGSARNGFAAGGAVARGMVRNEAAASAADRAIPGGSRPNYGNPTTGTAVQRGSAPVNGGGYYTQWQSNDWYSYNYNYLGAYNPYSWYFGFYRPYWYYPYDPSYMYGFGAFGMGAFYYDPAWWGGGAYGYGGGAYGSGGFMGGGYSGGGSSGSGSGWSDSASTGPKGGLKLKVTPKTAEVYVDGTRFGTVDNFDGAFKRLELSAGPHRIELRGSGLQSASFEVSIVARDTITYHGTLQPLPPVK